MIGGKWFRVIRSVEGDAAGFGMSCSVVRDGIEVNEMTGEIWGIPSRLGDGIDVSIKVWNEVGFEERSLTVVVKRFIMLGIVLMIIGGVILFCFVVVVMGRMVWMKIRSDEGWLKRLERKEYDKIWICLRMIDV